jgi:hypothetical protein
MEVADRRLETHLLGACLGGHVGVVNGNELANVRELVFRSGQLSRHGDDRLKPGVLPAQLGELLRVAERGRVGEGPLDLLGAGEGGR